MSKRLARPNVRLYGCAYLTRIMVSAHAAFALT